ATPLRLILWVCLAVSARTDDTGDRAEVGQTLRLPWASRPGSGPSPRGTVPWRDRLRSADEETGVSAGGFTDGSSDLSLSRCCRGLCDSLRCASSPGAIRSRRLPQTGAAAVPRREEQAEDHGHPCRAAGSQAAAAEVPTGARLVEYDRRRDR